MRRYTVVSVVAFATFAGACGSGNGATQPAVSSAGNGSGGSAGAEGGSSGSGATAGDPPVHVVRACPSDMASVGVWEEVTPQLQRDHRSYTGMLVPLVSPSDPATVYATSDTTGVFRSDDCGTTWVSPATGRGHAEMVSGRQWGAVMAQDDPQTLYVINGYGAAGLWKTSDGGVNWDQMFSADSEVAKAVPSLFTERVAIDPTNHDHLLVNFHDNCQAGHAGCCFAESTDGGSNWKIIDGPTNGWAEASGVLMLNAKTWLYATWFDGLWATTDQGVTWMNVTAAGAGGASDQLFAAADGTYYLASLQGVTSSPNGVTWTLIPSSGSGLHAMIGELETLGATPSNHPLRLFSAAQNGDLGWYSALESDPSSWQKLPDAQIPPANSYLFAYDPDHHILYASLQAKGLWRMRTY